MPTNNATGATKWTPEQDAQLTKLWSEGGSCSEIAAAWGITKNSVIGRVHRLKLPPRREARHSGGARERGVRERGVAIDRRTVSAERPEGKKGQRGNPGQPKAKGIVARQRSAVLAIRQNSGNAHFRHGSLPPEDHAGVDVTALVGLLDLKHDSCRWPIGDPLEPGFGFCGKTAKEGSSYCPGHHARAFKKAATE